MAKLKPDAHKNESVARIAKQLGHLMRDMQEEQAAATPATAPPDDDDINLFEDDA